MPSLHAAYATLVALFTIKLFTKKYRFLVLVYPAAIYFGTVYQGEHYIIDEVAGVLYALLAYYLAPYVLKLIKRLWQRVNSKFNKKPKPASK